MNELNTYRTSQQHRHVFLLSVWFCGLDVIDTTDLTETSKKVLDPREKKGRKIMSLKAESRGLFSWVVFLIHFLLAVKSLTCIHTRLSVYLFEGQPFRRQELWRSQSTSVFPHEEAEGDLAVFGPVFHEFCQHFKAIPQQLKLQSHKAAGHL